jgi:hypothetical protein
MVIASCLAVDHLRLPAGPLAKRIALISPSSAQGAALQADPIAYPPPLLLHPFLNPPLPASPSPAQGAALQAAKSSAMQQQLVAQLELARERIGELQKVHQHYRACIAVILCIGS